MQVENTSYDIDYAALHSLKLPDEYDTAIEQTAMDLDQVLDQKGTSIHFSDKIDLHRHAFDGHPLIQVVIDAHMMRFGADRVRFFRIPDENIRI